MRGGGTNHPVAGIPAARRGTPRIDVVSDSTAERRNDTSARMSDIVIAPDSFKGSLAAGAVAQALAEGWRERDSGARIVLKPMSDGGEGTLEAFAVAEPGARRMPVPVVGPDGRGHDAEWLLLPDGTGVVELASTSGIELLGERRLPWEADSTGFGQAIAAALEHGVPRLVLGIGSSASTDGGLGLLRALGARFTDADGVEVTPGAGGLRHLHAADLTGLRALPAGGATVITDVTNPLLGPIGAAAVFGPQKGLDADGVKAADAGLTRLAQVLGGDPAAPGSGAAGGAGYALRLWGAALAPGAEAIAGLIGLGAALERAALVITGEGQFDAQSAAGKVPAFVSGLARDAGVGTALVAGRVREGADTSAFIEVVSLTELAGGQAAAIAEPARWLREAGSRLATAASRSLR